MTQKYKLKIIKYHRIIKTMNIYNIRIQKKQNISNNNCPVAEITPDILTVGCGDNF